MISDVGISIFAGLGAAMWVYSKFARRATGREEIKNIAPALLAGFMVFIAALTILSAIF